MRRLVIAFLVGWFLGSVAGGQAQKAGQRTKEREAARGEWDAYWDVYWRISNGAVMTWAYRRDEGGFDEAVADLRQLYAYPSDWLLHEIVGYDQGGAKRRWTP